MAKVKQRKDSKGRVLQTGETQRKTDGMYIYRYVDPYGKRCYVYSKDLFTLREKEQRLIRDQMDGLDTYVGGHATINMAFDRYMSTKYNLRETTRSNYIYMFNKFVRDEFGNKKIVDVKYTEVKFFYYHLINEKNIAINTLETIHTLFDISFLQALVGLKYIVINVDKPETDDYTVLKERVEEQVPDCEVYVIHEGELLTKNE